MYGFSLGKIHVWDKRKSTKKLEEIFYLVKLKLYKNRTCNGDNRE